MAAFARCKRPSGRPHKGQPFTCLTCGLRACWSCALHFWPCRNMEEALRGRRVGFCSRACLAQQPKQEGAL